MSIRVMTWVWEHSSADGIDRLVLLAIADHASDDGTDAYPSIARLAAKTRVSERTVQRAVRALTLAGELTTDFGAGRGGANVYTVTMNPRQVVTPSESTGDRATPVNVSPRQNDGMTTTTPRGDNCVTQTVLEPSLTPRPPAKAGSGRRKHCPRHVRYKADCVNCERVENPPPEKPPWCGRCEQRTRLLESDDGAPQGRCPRCHPLKAVAS